MKKVRGPGAAAVLLVALSLVPDVLRGEDSSQASQAPTGVVTGRVVDPNGTPLALVAVSLGGQPLKAPKTVKTAVNGTYEIAGVPNGLYTLSFRLAGFAPLNRADIVVAKGAATVDVSMILDQRGHTENSIIWSDKDILDRLGSDGVLVRLQTSFGNIDIAVDTKRAPVTAANFLKYVDAGLYDGGRFHRSTRPDNYNTAPPNRPMMELIQGGISPEKKGQGFPAIPLERTNVTGIKHGRGVVSMARGGPGTATSDFCILLDHQPSLDFGGKRFDDNQGAAAFGGVWPHSLGVVERINQQPVQGQNLTPPVTIVSIRRIAR